jgi:hypothetical protein
VSRMLWFAAGAGAGVYTVVRARRVAQVFTADGLADRLAGLSLGLHLFLDEVRAGAAEKDTELRGRLGLAPPTATAAALDPGRTQDSNGPDTTGPHTTRREAHH